MIGSGRPFDTDKYFIICSNVIGGCKGSTGPSSIDPKTGKTFGMNFPVITIGDMVKAQNHLILWIILRTKSCSVSLVVPWEVCRFLNGLLNTLTE